MAASDTAGPLKALVFAAVIGGTFVVVLVVGVLMTKSDPKPDPSDAKYQPPRSQPVAEARPTAPPVLPPNELIMTKTTLVEAIVVAKPHMADATNDLDTGTALLGVWSTTRMKWSDVSQIQPETSVARVMKDSDLERGKRICASGSIAEIVAEKVGTSRLYNGALMLGDGGVVRFAAVGDTGTLVANSSARFCGIVTGRFIYSNAIGGTTHAVRLVGMFDTPGNRAAK